MDKAEIEIDGLETLEEMHNAVQRVDKTWSTSQSSRAWGRIQKPLANVP